MPNNLPYLLSWEKIISIPKNIETQPQKAVLLISIFIITVLIVLTSVALIVFRPPKEKRKFSKKLTKKQLDILASIIFTIVLIVFVSGMYYLSSPAFCRSCHTMKGAYDTWKKSVHKNTNCLSCHQKPGVIGFGIEKMRMISRIISQLTQSYKKPITAEVWNESCLSCHSDITRETKVKYTIRVSHKEILNGGYKCIDCHNTIAHGNLLPDGKYPSMKECLPCHNDKQASSDCRLCHVEDIGKKPREKMNYPKVHLQEPTNCRGCHSLESCTACHGLEMPHPPTWEEGKHARDAFVNKKVCWKCHTNGECAECHTGNWPHPSSFVQTHGRDISSCFNCHPRNLCNICHPERKQIGFNNVK